MITAQQLIKKHIVLIDDDAEFRQSVSEVLNSTGYRVTTLNEMTSHEELAGLKADCFLIDEKLPVISGHIICIMLKSKPVTSNIPVILVSAANNLNAAATLGDADGYLNKPFDLNKLLEKVESVCKWEKTVYC